jgi:Carboxypeptidase regulatory-like domain
MNRGLLAILVLLTLAAAVAVLLDPNGDPAPIPDTPGIEASNQEDGLDQAEAGPGLGSRIESASGVDQLESDPSAIVGQILGPKGTPLPYAKVVFAHRQFGSSKTGWATEAVLQVGENCDAKGRFRLPVESNPSDLTIVVACKGYAPARRSNVSGGDIVDFRLSALIEAPGQVFDPTGAPAASVPVEFFDPNGSTDGLPSTTLSNREGRFELPAPGAGTYSIRVKSAAGIEFVQSGIQVKEGMAPIEIHLNGDLSLMANLQDSTGLPLPGASLELFPKTSRRPLKLTSQEDGVFRAYGLSTGRWKGTVHLEGYADLMVEFQYAIGGTMHFDWILQRNGSVRVTTTSGKGRPMEGTLLRLMPDPAGINPRLNLPEIRTNSEGVAKFERVPPGRYVVTPERLAGISPGALFEDVREDTPSKGQVAFSQLIDVREGEQTELTLVLKRHGFLILEVNRGGLPVVGARGTILLGSGPRKRNHDALDLSDLQGNLVFPATWMGEYSIELQGSPAELSIIRSIEFGRGQNERSVELPSGQILGQVLSGSQAVTGAQVWAARAGESLKQLSRTDSSGKFEILGLESGIYQIKIEASGLASWENLALEHDGGRFDLGNLQLQQSFNLNGRVEGLVLAENNLFGPVITVFDGQNKSVASRALAADGSFSVTGLAAGTYLVRVFQAGQEILSRDISIPLTESSLVLQVP